MSEYRCCRKMCTVKATVKYYGGDYFCVFHDPKVSGWRNMRETVKEDKVK